MEYALVEHRSYGICEPVVQIAATNDTLAPQANFVRNYMENPHGTYLDPVGVDLGT